MKLLYGEPVTAADVEQLTSAQDERAFVRLCATLVGCAAGELGGGFVVPNWTERITVPDKGIDAEYVANPDTVEAGGLVGPGRNVYQIKWRRLATRPARSVFQQLRREMKGALQEMRSRGAVLPDRYVLLVNLDLSGSDHNGLAKAIREACPEFVARPVIVWGAAEIASALNLHPHIRHAFFSDGIFCTLASALEDLQARYAGIGWPDFVGCQEVLRSIRSFLGTNHQRLLVVSGPPYAGKTRVVLEALSEDEAKTVWASDPDVVTESHFRAMEGSKGQSLLVVDNCAPDHLEPLGRWARSRTQLKTILISKLSPNWPDVPRVEIKGLPDQDCSGLLARAAPNLPPLMQEWVSRIAGKNPGLLLYALAALRGKPRDPALLPRQQDPRQTVMNLLQDALLSGLPTEEREALQVLAILPQVGVEEDRAKELEILCRLLGRDLLRVRGAIPSLEQRHLLIRRGRFAEVVPEILASAVVADVLRARPNLISYFWLNLERISGAAQDRFLGRLIGLAGDPTLSQALDEVFSPTGWFRTIDDLRCQVSRFRRLAEVRPVSAMPALKRLLADMDASAIRATITGDLRREVVWGLETLALRAKTFDGAAEVLLRLAEGENENVLNSATGVFLSIFHWRHLEVSAPHSERVEFLRRNSRDPSPARRQLIARAAASSIGPPAGLLLHQSPLSSRPEEPARLPLWGDVWDFHGAILGILRALARDPESSVREAAISGLLEGARESLHLSVLRDGLDDLAEICFDTLREMATSNLPLGQVVGLRSTLELIRDDFELKSRETTKGAQRHEGVRLAGQKLLEIERILEDRSFSGRLRRWVGPRSHEDQRTDDDAIIRGAPLPSDQRLAELAESVCREPSLLTPALLEWLVSSEAEHGPRFFLTLGKLDSGQRLQGIFIDRVSSAGGQRAFGFYLAGKAQNDRSAAEDLLDTLRTDDASFARAALVAISLIPGDERSVRRLLELTAKKTVRPDEALGIVRYGGWIRSLDVEDVIRLICGLDDGSPEVTAGLVDLLGDWILYNPKMPNRLQEKVWPLLDRSSAIANRALFSAWDRLAGSLSEASSERFVTFLAEQAGRKWKRGSEGPIGTLQDHARFWKPILWMNREGVLQTLLSALTTNSSPPSWVRWCLHQFVDPDKDEDTLVAFAVQAGEGGALTVANILDAGKSGSWKIATRLIQAYPENQQLAAVLSSAVIAKGAVGSFVSSLQESLMSASALLGHKHPRVSQWAREVVDCLEGWIRSEQKEDQEKFIWDYRISRRQLEELLEKKDTPDRRWAIQRILKRAPQKEVFELLTIDDIREGLEFTELSEAERRKWEEYLGHWSGRV